MEIKKASKIIGDYWDIRSSTYEEEHEMVNLDIWKKYLLQMLGDDKNIKILDLATGTGMIANMIGELGYKNIVGMDLSERMMEIGKKHAEERNTGVEFMYGNALDIPYDDDSVDVIISCRLLWTLIEPDKALEEWKRVVKKGGKIIAIQEMLSEKEKADNDLEAKEEADEKIYGGEVEKMISLSNATKEKNIELFKRAALKDVEFIYLKGCKSLENEKENWHAIIGLNN